MKRNRWQEITELYHAALELPENERASFLAACADDPIRCEVQSLLANEKDVHSIFETSAVDAAASAAIKPRDSLAGRKFGSYQLTSEIGRGGMGEVYRAKDQKLGRDVAIKVLPEEFAANADRVVRFQQEARLLASLNHPNIAAIHGLEKSGGIHFLVLELVEGETLAERLKRGPMPVEEALQLALQITEALEAAHENRVIHRDLKPANIGVSPDNRVKVLDFGLAKAFAEEQQLCLSDSPAVSATATRQGVILGTAVFFPGVPGPFAKSVLVWVDRNGNEQQIPVPPNYYGISSVSQDGTKMATAIGGIDGNLDIYVYDFIGQTPLRRLTFDKSIESAPVWAPDGKRIVFRSNQNGEGIYWKRADGNGEVAMLLSVPDRVLFPSSFSPDGKMLAFTAVSPSTDEDIGILSLQGRREWKLLLQEKHGESNPQISPNGRFMAYSSTNELGRTEVFIRSFPDMQKQWQVTTEGGHSAGWCATGKELFYRNGDAFLVVPVETDPELKLGTPRVLFRWKYASSWDLSPDSKRFLLHKRVSRADKPASPGSPSRINIIMNWLEELKQRIPSP